MKAKESRTTENLLGIIQRSEEASVVRSAIIDLGYSADEKAYPALVNQLDHPSLHVQHAAVLSLGRLGHSRAIPELVKPKIYRSRAANIRWAAVAAVGKLGDFRVIHHLLKAVEGWSDMGLGAFQLAYLRDKQQREVDFVVIRNNRPWFLAEVKQKYESISPSLRIYQEQTKAPFAFQVIMDAKYEDANCFEKPCQPLAVPARTFLAQLL